MMQIETKLSSRSNDDENGDDTFSDFDEPPSTIPPKSEAPNNSKKLILESDDDWEDSDENESTVDKSNNDPGIQINNIIKEPVQNNSGDHLNNKDKGDEDSDDDWGDDDSLSDSNNDNNTANSKNNDNNSPSSNLTKPPPLDPDASKKIMEEQRRKLSEMTQGRIFFRLGQSLNDEENEYSDSKDTNNVSKNLDPHDDDNNHGSSDNKNQKQKENNDLKQESEEVLSSNINQDANDDDSSEKWDSDDDSSDQKTKSSSPSDDTEHHASSISTTLIEKPQKTEPTNSVEQKEEEDDDENNIPSSTRVLPNRTNSSSLFSETSTSKIEDSNKISLEIPSLADDKILNSIHSSFFIPPYLNIQERVVQQKTKTVTRCKSANTFSFISLIVSCIMAGVVIGLNFINLHSSLITYLSFSLLISFILLGFNLWFGISETVEDRTVVTESKLPSSELPSKKAISFWKTSDYSTKKKENNEKSYVDSSVKDKYGDKDDDETFDFDGDLEEKLSKISGQKTKPSQPKFNTPETLLPLLSKEPEIQSHFKNYFDTNDKLMSRYKDDLDKYKRECSDLKQKVDTLSHENSILTNTIHHFTRELTNFKNDIEKDPNCASLEERKIIERINRDYSTTITYILNNCQPEQKKNIDSKSDMETKLVFKEIPEKKRYPRKYLRKVKRSEKLEQVPDSIPNIPNIRNGKWYFSADEMYELFKQDMKQRIAHIEDMEARERTSIIPHIKSPSGDDDFRDSRDFSQQEMYEIRNGVYQHKTELYNFGLDNIQFSSEVFAPQNKIRELCKKRLAILSVE
nr:unnamed protein product [Naegleria fowleri]